MPLQNALNEASQKMDMSSSLPSPFPLFSLFDQYPPVAALSFLVWDILITLDQEVDAIWSCVLLLYSGIAFSHLSFRRTNTSYSKWFYFFVRYFAVAMQMYFYPPYLIRHTDYSTSLSSSLLFVGTELSIAFHYTESDCVKWYIFQEVGTQLLVAVVESILIVRGTL